MHFAMGMGCAAAVSGTACLIVRRGFRFIPAAMTLGGIWALVPDMPRIFREDFPNLPFASALGAKGLERKLHSIGDVFFFHGRLDAQPQEYALLGLGIILLLYNLSIALLMTLEWQQRNSIGNRSWRAHQHQMRRRRREEKPPPPEPDGTDDGDPVIHRIRPNELDRTG